MVQIQKSKCPKGCLVQLSIHLLLSVPEKWDINVKFEVTGYVLYFKVIYSIKKKGKHLSIRKFY